MYDKIHHKLKKKIKKKLKKKTSNNKQILTLWSSETVSKTNMTETSTLFAFSTWCQCKRRD